MRWITVAVLVAGFTAAGCDEPNTLTAPTALSTLDGSWRLARMSASGTTHTEPTTAGRFTVTFSGGRIQAKADCNTCAGAATLAGDRLTVGPLACTRAFCATSAPLDTQFTSLLDGALTVRVNDRLLVLTSAAGELGFER